MSRRSPFDSKVPSTELGYFYGRDSEVETILSGIFALPPQSFVISAGYRMGKTSLISYIFQSLDELEPERIIKISVDTAEIQQKATSLLELIYHKLLGSVQNWFDKHNVAIPQSVLGSIEYPLPVSYLQRITYLQGWVSQNTNQLKIVISIERLEYFTDLNDWESVARQLAYIVEHTSISFILAGRYSALNRIEAYTSPLMALFERIHLRCLTVENTIKLIIEQTSNLLSPEIVELIVQETGGHPYIIQCVMEQLWNLTSGNMQSFSSDLVIRITADLPIKHRNIGLCFKRVHSFSLKVFSIVLISGEVTREEIISMSPAILFKEEGLQEKLADAIDTDDALEELIASGLLVEDEKTKRYKVSSPIIARFWERISKKNKYLNFERENENTNEHTNNVTLRRELFEILNSRFNEEELKTLCFQLDVDFESLEAIGKINKVRELISFLERRNRIEEVLEVGKSIRPDIEWPTV